MPRKTLVIIALVCLLGMKAGVAAQRTEGSLTPQQSLAGAQGRPNAERGTANAPGLPRSINEIIHRVFKRETEEEETIASYTPIIETYIQIEKSDPLMGTLPKRDLYFLGIAAFHNGTMKVYSMTEKTSQESPINSIMWSFEPSGFLQMAFLDWGAFDNDHYLLKPAGRAFLGEVRCYIFDVARTPKAKGPRFRGRIWVEDQDFTIVRMNGDYAPEQHFSVRRLDDEFYVHFDAWRTNVKPGLWLPSERSIRLQRHLAPDADRSHPQAFVRG